MQPEGEAAEAALDAHVAAIPGARLYAGWDDFSLWVLEVERVRWVGGFARMDTVSREEYRAAEPDPTQPIAAKAVEHLNKSHTDGLLAIARELAGARGAVSAVCTGIDRYGIDLSCTGAGQSAAARVEFDEPLTKAADVRPATVELAQRARALQAGELAPRASPAGSAPAGTSPGKSGKSAIAERRAGPPVEQRPRVADRRQQPQRGADLQVGGVGPIGSPPSTPSAIQPSTRSRWPGSARRSARTASSVGAVHPALDRDHARRDEPHDRARQPRQLRGLLVARDRARAALQRAPARSAARAAAAPRRPSARPRAPPRGAPGRSAAAAAAGRRTSSSSLRRIAREPLTFSPPSSFSAGTVRTPKRSRMQRRLRRDQQLDGLVRDPLERERLLDGLEGCDDWTT